MRAFLVFHVLWLVAAVAEREILGARMPSPPFAWGLAGLLAVVEAMRVSVLATLGRRWTIEVVVVPGEAPIARGPYRWTRHPNYAVVIAEVLLLPLLVGSWRTAILGSLLHAPILAYRIRREEAAWRDVAGSALRPVARFVPGAAPRKD